MNFLFLATVLIDEIFDEDWLWIDSLWLFPLLGGLNYFCFDFRLLNRRCFVYFYPISDYIWVNWSMYLKALTQIFTFDRWFLLFHHSYVLFRGLSHSFSIFSYFTPFTKMAILFPFDWCLNYCDVDGGFLFLTLADFSHCESVLVF